MDPNKKVTLKNGAQELETSVTVCYAHLVHLWKQEPVAFFELVYRARDRAHAFIFEDARQKLIALQLIGEHGDMHEITRNVVLSAVTGDSPLDMVLSFPVESGPVH